MRSELDPTYFGNYITYVLNAWAFRANPINFFHCLTAAMFVGDFLVGVH